MGFSMLSQKPRTPELKIHLIAQTRTLSQQSYNISQKKKNRGIVVLLHNKTTTSNQIPKARIPMKWFQMIPAPKFQSPKSGIPKLGFKAPKKQGYKCGRLRANKQGYITEDCPIPSISVQQFRAEKQGYQHSSLKAKKKF